MDRPLFVAFKFLFECVQLSVMQMAEPDNFVWLSVIRVMHFRNAVADYAWAAFEPSSCQSFCCDFAPVVSGVFSYVVVGCALFFKGLPQLPECLGRFVGHRYVCSASD